MNTTDLKIMSYNVLQTLEKEGRREDFMEELGATVRKFDPDVFGTQENTTKLYDGMMAGVSGYDVHKGQPYYDGNFLGNYVYWKADKFTALEKGHKFMSDTPDVKSKYEASCWWRGFTYVLFEIKESGKRFLFVDLHTDYRGPEEVRVAQLKVLTSFLKPYHERNIPVIVVGDFNTIEGKDGIATFEADNPWLGMTSKTAKTKGDTGSTLAVGGFTQRDKYTFDFIFASKAHFDVEYYSVVDNIKDGKYPSDHLPVVAKLQIY